MSHKPNSVESIDKLLERLNELKNREQALCKEINDLHDSGVKDDDSEDIMIALHSYNEIKDTIIEVFTILCKLKDVTSADLHLKYNIPME